MSDKTPKKREAPISYRPPAELRDKFHSRVKQSGLSTCAYITKCCLNIDPPRQSRRPSIEEKLLGKLLAQSAAIRMNLDAIDSASHEMSETEVLLEQAVDELGQIRAALLKTMGRKP